MFNVPQRATLSAALLARPRHTAACVPVNADPGCSVVSLFCAKPALSARHHPRTELPTDAAALARRAETKKFSLRITPERRFKMKLAAAYLRQSCQSLIVDAIDRHIERVVRDPGNRTLEALFNSATAVCE